ncbi:MAG TPA: energy-coupling factor transporter transmembrane protein EcfT [Gelria sp.]|nr:energy-coupling factor transporter transmembrane protein EcfT [Gelria sp.]
MENYHVRSVAVYLLVWFLLALFYNNLLQLTLMLAAIILLNYRLDRLGSLRKITSFILPLAALIVLINSLFNQNGDILLTSLNIFNYTLPIYQEAIVFGVAMAIKLILILAIFTAFNILIPVERLMDIFGSYNSRSVLVVAISAALIPDMVERFHSIGQVQRCRGVQRPGKGLWERTRNLGPLLLNLLRSSLQAALQMAEAMQARGYGSSKRRSVYQIEKWQLQDWLLLFLALTVLGLALLGWYTGYRYHYRPLEQVSLPVYNWEVLALFFLSLPFLQGGHIWSAEKD